MKLVEKYEHLDEKTKSILGTIETRRPIEILDGIDKKRAQIERLWIVVIISLSIVTYVLLLYELGLPKSIGGFFSGFMLFFFSLAIIPVSIAIISGLLISLPLNLALTLTNTYKYAKSVENAYEVKVNELKSEEHYKRLERIKRQQEKSIAIQKDFDAIEKYFISETANFMPRSRLTHTTEELSKTAISWAIHESKNLSKTESDRGKAIEYYRHLSSLLHFVADDDTVELFERKTRVGTLLLETDISETLRNELLAEYSRLNSMKDLLSMVERSKSSKYLETFDECVKLH